MAVPPGTEPVTILNALKNWSNPFYDNSGNPPVVVDPDSIDVGPHIVREFVGEVNFTSADVDEIPEDDVTNLVSQLLVNIENVFIFVISFYRSSC